MTSMKRGEFLKLLTGSLAAASLPRIVAENATNPNVVEEYEVNRDFTFAGPGLGRRVSITFDDGPNPGTTETVLEELRKRDIKATFFMIGKNVNAYPDLAKKVRDDGHELANHSYSHPILRKMSDEKVNEELSRCQEAIEKATGAQAVWFRPPYGAFSKAQDKLAINNNLGVVIWSVDPFDWKKPGPSVVTQRVLAQTAPGRIILLHDIHRQTAEAIPAILDGLLERDYSFTTMSGFLGNPNIARTITV